MEDLKELMKSHMEREQKGFEKMGVKLDNIQNELSNHNQRISKMEATVEMFHKNIERFYNERQAPLEKRVDTLNELVLPLKKLSSEVLQNARDIQALQSVDSRHDVQFAEIKTKIAIWGTMITIAAPLITTVILKFLL